MGRQLNTSHTNYSANISQL